MVVVEAALDRDLVEDVVVVVAAKCRSIDDIVVVFVLVTD